MALFQGLRQGDGPNMEKAPLGDNLRPRYTLYLYICNIYKIYNIIFRQPLNNRAVRTNIAVQGQKVGIIRLVCSSVAPDVHTAVDILVTA